MKSLSSWLCFWPPAFVVLMFFAGCGAKQAAPKKSPEEVKKDYQQQAQRMQQDINRSRGK